MNSKDTWKDFISDPEGFYSKLDSLTAEERKEFMALEEGLVSLKFDSLAAVDEGRIAEIADSLMSGKKSDADTSELASALEMLSACRKMQSGQKREVPDALMAVIERSLKYDAKKAKSPSLIVKLAEQGIEVIKSTLQGVSYVPQPVPSMRSSAAAQKNTAPLVFKQEFSGNVIEYSILKESPSEMMFSMNFPSKHGVYSIQLKKEGRILDAVKLSEADKSVTFRKLEEGYYDIEITGSVEHNFCIYIEKE